MKQAFCIRNTANINGLYDKTIPTVEGMFVNRDICEQVAEGYVQLIPYVVIYSVSADKTRLQALQYVRPDTGEGEQRLAGKSSVGFGGHIDLESEVVSTTVNIAEDGSKTYDVSLEDLSATAYNCATRELGEELGLDLTKYGIDITQAPVVYFTGNPEEDVNKVHAGLGVAIRVSEDTFAAISSDSVIKPDEIAELGHATIRLDAVVEGLNVMMAIRATMKDMIEKYNLEGWSCVMLEFIIQGEINNVVGTLTYADLVNLSNAKKDLIQQQAAAQPAVESEPTPATEVAPVTTTEAVDASATEVTAQAI